jgi:autophagy-related protein 17
MNTLRSTMVASAFRPADEKPRTLLDFIDESSVETLRTSLKQTIDASQSSRSTFLSSVKAFDADRQALKTAISSAPSPNRTKESPIPPLLHELETHAAEMAVLLDSLTSHFDLCANAVKHTEGGFLALKNAVVNNPLPDGVTVSGVIPSPDASSHLSPMSEEERKEMLQVLMGDASEVPAVVQDLDLRLLEMEHILPQITAYVAEQRSAYTATTAAFAILESISSRLAGYIGASTTFLAEWQANKALLEAQAQELDGMRLFYEGYYASYDGLILEVARRKAAEEKMKSILRKALEQVQKLHDADTRKREGFRREVGEFLPSDLWPGLVANAPRWEVGIFGEEGEENQDSTPELGKTAVEEAIRREKERGG